MGQGPGLEEQVEFGKEKQEPRVEDNPKPQRSPMSGQDWNEGSAGKDGHPWLANSQGPLKLWVLQMLNQCWF